MLNWIVRNRTALTFKLYVNKKEEQKQEQEEHENERIAPNKKK